MTTPVSNDYGHAGEAQYDVERHEWLFTREVGHSEHLQLLETPVVTLSSAIEQECAVTHENARSRTKSTKELITRYPSLATVSEIIATHGQISEDIELLEGLHDPHESDLLAFGHATEIDRSAEHLKRVPVAALPGGPSKCDLVIVRLSKEVLGWEQKQLQLKSNTFKNGDRMIWEGGWGPIRQLKFSHIIGSSRPWLAIRCSQATVLLQLIFKRNDDTARFKPSLRQKALGHGSSQVGSSHLLVLPVDMTGGSSHIDVAFNPFRANQYAVIDQQGRWTVWMLEKHRRRGIPWDLRNLVDGRDDGEEGNAQNAANTVMSGWGRIRWVRDSWTISVVSRKSVALFSIRRNRVRHLPAPSLIPAESADCILDFKEDHLNADRFYIVTSTQVLYLKVDPENSLQSGGVQAGATVIICWRHFRSFGDLSLRISTCRSTEATLVLLYSTLTGLATVQILNEAASDPAILPTITAPSILVSTESTKANALHASYVNISLAHKTSIAALTLRTLDHELKKVDTSTSNEIRCLERRNTFYQLIALDHNLNVYESLCVDHPELAPTLPDTRNLIVGSKSAATIAVEKFVVPSASDDEEYTEDLLTSTKPKSELILRSSARNKLLRGLTEDQWTLNVEWLAHHLEHSWAGGKKEFNELLAGLRPLVNETSSNTKWTSKSLLELSSIDISRLEYNVTDVDIASISLEEFLRKNDQGFEDRDNVELSQHLHIIADTPMNSICHKLGLGLTIELSQIYEYMVRYWISTLPPNSPGRVRLITEKLARTIAAQLSLAWYRLDPSISPLDSGHDEAEAPNLDQLGVQALQRSSSPASSGPSKWVLPPKMNGSAAFAQSSQQSLPTPEPTPSIRSRSSMSSLYTGETLASQRIRSRVAHLMPQQSSDSSISSIMSHWDDGVNPHLYDWEVAKRTDAVDNEGTDVDDSSQQRRKRRLEKKRARLQGRTDLPSSQPKSRETQSSQVQESLGTQQSDLAGEPIVMSQAEPGSYGSRRNMVKNKSQKRRAGF